MVTISNLQSKCINCEAKREKLLDILLSATDWMHACGGKGKCTSCKANILEGMENLTPRTREEEQFHKLNKLQDNQRLTCQTFVTEGDVVLEVPKETQLPHLKYSD